MKAKNKCIIVTGGGNGVGREIVLQLLQKEATVIAIDINEAALQETCRIAGEGMPLFTYVVDISNRDKVFAFAEQVKQDHPNIDGIINNAGIIQPFVNFNELEMDRIDRVMNINYYGTVYMIKAFLPLLLTRPEAHIVNVSSMGGFLPVPGQSVYGASKAAVKLLSEGLHSELTDTNVNISVVIPGGIATDIKVNSDLVTKTKEDSKKAGAALTPQKAATLVIKAMENNKFRLYIGKDCNAMNVLYKLVPNLAMSMISKVMKSSEH